MIWPSTAGIAALGAAVVLAGTHWFVFDLGKDRVAAQWSKDREEQAQAQAQRAQEHAKQVEEYRSKEQALQKLLDDSARSNRDEISRIARQRDVALRSLRDRPILRAPAPDPQAAPGAGSGTGCTGAGLARPDAEFLVRYAADAARTADALKTCLDSYRKVRDILNASTR